MIINYGASFSLNYPFLELIQTILIVLLGIIWWKEKRAWGFILMILGGGLNMLERKFFGGVEDYWRIPFTSIYNNLNDYLIFLGVVQIIWYLIWKKRQK